MSRSPGVDIGTRSPHTTRGAALLIILAIVVLIAGLVLAFFSRATNERAVSVSSATRTKVELFAQGALDQIVGDIKQEIAAGSTALAVSGVYPPKAPATIVPALVGSSGAAGYENLVKRSAYNLSFYPNTANYDANASNRAAGPSTQSATSIASLNGRYISAARWNKPLLITKATLTSDTDMTPAATFTSPDWILVARNGSNPAAWNSNLQYSATTPTAVMGRYAYMMYDEGGLLDANVAGYPSPTPAPGTPIYGSTIGRKGSTALADLTQLAVVAGQPRGIAAMTSTRNGVVLQNKVVNNIVGWRNFASAAATGVLGTLSSSSTYAFPSNNYYSYVSSNQNGFLTTGNTGLQGGESDRMFGSRQELIKFFVQGVASTSGDRANLQNALTYLTTFSRELNAPSWKPVTPTGSTVDYGTLAATPSLDGSTATNRSFPNVRVGATFNRSDGSTAIAGEPLVRRFALTRINNLTTTSGTTQRDFGLRWNTDHWDYVGASTTNAMQPRILTLDEIAAGRVLDAAGAYESTRLYREPNFFELLKASILSGSVGLGSGNANTFISMDDRYNPAKPISSDTQIIQIGANIIDQWDADNIPTFINFAGTELAGIENLPYLNKLVFKPYQDSSANTYRAWLIPSLWNPWQNASSAVRIQIVYTGTGATASFSENNSQFTSNALPTNSFMEIDSSLFTTSPTSPSTAAPSSANVTNSFGANGLGFEYTFTGPPPSFSNRAVAYPDFAGVGTFELKLLVGGVWKRYQRWSVGAIGHPLVCDTNGKGMNASTVDPEAVALDPRTTRFGVWGNAAGDKNPSGISQDYTLGPYNALNGVGGGAHQWEPITKLWPTGVSNFKNTNSGSLYRYADNSDNSKSSPVYYTDLDGVQRPGDFPAPGTNVPNTVDADEPLYAADAYSPPCRQRMVNAPFQSIGELGEVFRDQPWKTLNFMSTESADAALLDLFTLHDTAIVAGRTSLNTRQRAILTAILSQALKAVTNTTTVLSTTERDNVVTALMNAAPMLNKAELVTTLCGDSSVTALGTSLVNLAPPLSPKEGRETIVRAFADACQTRTWNLMIDVIAQSGRYPPNAAALSDFIVEGEKRYWLHVAIDRYTGQVIDQQLEAVYE